MNSEGLTKARTWMDDRREQSGYVIKNGKLTFHVKATPDEPGGNRYVLTCLELPGWSGRCAYAGRDPRDNAVFQFWMQTRDLRAALNHEPPPQSGGE